MTDKEPHNSRVSHPPAGSESRELSPLALVCKLGEQRVGIELRFVDEVFRTGYVTPVPSAPACFVGLTNLRGRVIVLIDPAEMLFSTPPSRALPGRTAVLVSWHNIRAGLLVDHIEDVMSAKDGVFEPAPETSLLAGTLQTNEVSLDLLHVERLLRQAVARSTEAGANLARQVAS